MSLRSWRDGQDFNGNASILVSMLGARHYSSCAIARPLMQLRAPAARILVAVDRGRAYLPRVGASDISQSRRELVVLGFRRASPEQRWRNWRLGCRPVALSVRTVGVVVGYCRRGGCRFGLPPAYPRSGGTSPPLAGDPGFRAGAAGQRIAGSVASLPAAGLAAQRAGRSPGGRDRSRAVARTRFQRRDAAAHCAVRDWLVASHRHVVAKADGTCRWAHRKYAGLGSAKA